MKVLINGVESELGDLFGVKIHEDGDRLRIVTDQGVMSAVVIRKGDKTLVSVDGRVLEVEKYSASRSRAGVAGSGEGRAPMPGQIVEVLVADGDEVAEGQTLIILEAMKMQQPIKADFAGIVSGLNVNVGDQVNDGQLLVQVMKPNE
ncbi:MAG: acetyl-CoA carboxylase biotin carboxyl carrier protein subunit [Fimbriimonadaceae bacterium]